MSVKNRIKHIVIELRGHGPFTVFGAVLGIAFMLVFRGMAGEHGRVLFSIFHPAHVVLSAMVTASMFKIHATKKRLLLILVIGYFGSVGVATVSDIIIPHFGAQVLGLDMPSHAEMHEHEHVEGAEEEHGEVKHTGIHLGFIEEWYIVNPAAILGVLIAFFLPRTKFPHAGHVLISTWASSSYLLMSTESQIGVATGIGIFVILFLAVWVPCCVSDIIFPLLFVKSDIELVGACPVHERHSHEHIQKQGEGETSVKE